MGLLREDGQDSKEEALLQDDSTAYKAGVEKDSIDSWAISSTSLEQPSHKR